MNSTTTDHHNSLLLIILGKRMVWILEQVSSDPRICINYFHHYFFSYALGCVPIVTFVSGYFRFVSFQFLNTIFKNKKLVLKLNYCPNYCVWVTWLTLG